MARAPVYREIIATDGTRQRQRMTASELTVHEQDKGTVASDEREARIAALEARLAAVEARRV